MDYTQFLDILILILFLLIAAGFFGAIKVFLVIKNKRTSIEPEKEKVSEGSRKTLKANRQGTLKRNKLMELLSELEREKRTAAFGFISMTNTHQEVAKARLRKIEANLNYVRAQLDKNVQV